jgi:hypothetical protein
VTGGARDDAPAELVGRRATVRNGAERIGVDRAVTAGDSVVMWRIVVLLAVMTGACGVGDDVDGPTDPTGPFTPPGPGASDELYAADGFPTFELEIAADQMAALRARPDEYARARFRHRDEVIADVGVKLKGEYSFRTIDEKPGLKLKFDEFVDRQTFRGLRRMVLNNLAQDPSFVAERVAYRVFREAGLAAPRANSARVRINGMDYGVYANVEAEDKTFLARWFASNDGNLYEEDGSDWAIGSESGFELETNEATGDRSDLTRLFAAADAASGDSFLATAGEVLDMDAFLRFVAVEALVDQGDGYAYNRNNYRLYRDPARDRFYLLPWGMDQAFKPEWSGLISLYQPRAMFITRCLATAPCRARFDQIVDEETARFAGLDLVADVDAAVAQIRDAVMADPRKEWGSDQFERNAEIVRTFIADRPATIRP